MKKRIALFLVVVFIIALFAGCGGSPDNSEPSSSPSITDDAGGSPSTEPEEDSPYNFAKGNFDVNADGFPTSSYAYELPITTTDEVLTFWTTCWTPQFIPGDGDYNNSPFPVELETRTGVNVEYVMIAGETRAENFAVLLAADDLCDITSSAVYLYSGTTFDNAVLEEEYFANIYDYKDYCPNYVWEATKDPTDETTYKAVFSKDDLITTFYMLKDKGYIQMDYFARGDWLQEVGLTNDDVKTFDQLHDMLTLVKSQIDESEYPLCLYSTLEIGGTYVWTAYDTFNCVADTIGPLVYVVDGVVKHANMNENDLDLMTMINQWYSEGLIDPNWSAYDTNNDMPGDLIDGKLVMAQMTANGAAEHQAIVDEQSPDSDIGWVPLTRPVLYEGQTIHLGGDTRRLHYGTASISAKCENIPLAVSWVDYRYSEEGSILCSYGVEGLSWNFDENGEPALTELMYNNPDTNLTMIGLIYRINELCDPGLQIQFAQYAYPGCNAPYAHEYWADYSYDAAYRWPPSITLTTEQQETVNALSADIVTYIQENYTSFVDGSKPLSEWNSYVTGLKALGMDEALAVYQQAYDDYMATKSAA